MSTCHVPAETYNATHTHTHTHTFIKRHLDRRSDIREGIEPLTLGLKDDPLPTTAAFLGLS